MKTIKKPLTAAWEKAKRRRKEKNIKEAVEMFDIMLVYLAKLTEQGVTEVEDSPIDLWKNRCWGGIEGMGMLPPYRG